MRTGEEKEEEEEEKEEVSGNVLLGLCMPNVSLVESKR